MKLYVASSWRNEYLSAIVDDLRSGGHEVFDFRAPVPGDSGFRWNEIDPKFESWTPRRFITELSHPVALNGFWNDFNAMKWADGCVLALPCNRSAHLEAGWFLGQGKPTYILIPPDYPSPELMYLLCGRDRLFTSMADLLDELTKDQQRPF